MYVKWLPSTSRTRSSYPVEKTLPSGMDASPETRFVCPWPASVLAVPVESYESTRPSADPTKNVSDAVVEIAAAVMAFWGPCRRRTIEIVSALFRRILAKGISFIQHVHAEPSQASSPRCVYRTRSNIRRKRARRWCPGRSIHSQLADIRVPCREYMSWSPCGFRYPLVVI